MEIKNINHVVYQLLIWELYVLIYLKVYNIFDFLNINYIKNIYDQQEIESIKFFIEIMDYMKYNLKIRYHFSTSLNESSNNSKISPNFGFMKLIENLINYLEEQNMTLNSEFILRSSNNEWEQIGDSYFESKDIIPFNSKPILYEKVLLKIISSETEEMVNSSFVSTKNDMDISRNGLNNNYNYSNNINLNSLYGEKPMFNNSNTNLQSQNNYIYFNNIPNNIIIKIILFYLDINDLLK